MGPKNDYEEVRRQRLEENKRRMEELNLTGLATSLKQVSNSATKSAKRSSNPRKQRTEEGPVVVRRSSRVANNPPADYREAPIDIPYLRKSYSRRSIFSHAIASVEASREAVEHAYNIESGLGSTYPTFVKPMLHSHISSGFWLGLPADFCKTHLPKQNTRMILEDETGDETETLYLAGKVGLSAGWRGFSIDHGLIEGDCLVFQLIPPSRFKVYIVRSADFETGKRRAADSDTDAVQELSVQELSVSGKRKRSSEDEEEASDESVEEEEVSNESVEGNDKLSKKSKMSKAKDGKQEPKKSGKKPLQNSDVEEQEKQQDGSDKGQQLKAKEDTTAGPKSKGAQVKSKSKKQINSMMPIRKASSRSQDNIKPSNGRIMTVAA
ncbi:B3 domain-containing protein Os06g0194400 [Cryptomeria japonica]|uniref:B3 domain-containing protein Os06g0194400 n=1 Tax=Cryptomeria japonica TaxID=3369 RepID=UPI0027DA4B51|nr:B3 domain-containing protein Os06g0194400 [Cryptomeria japonica]